MAQSTAHLRCRTRQAPGGVHDEAGIVKLARRLVAIQEGCAASLGTIFSVSDDVPEHFDARNPPHGIQSNSREATLLQRLYDSKTVVKCHIESCKRSFEGFGQILHHKRAERDALEAKPKLRAGWNDAEFRKISKRKARRLRSPRIHICLDEKCLASFNKGFNANRHYFTQHKDRRRNHARKAMVDDSADASTASSRTSSDHIEYHERNKCAGTKTAALQQRSRADHVNDAERSSHTTVTHSFDDRSAADVSRQVSNDIREGALSLMKLRYPDEVTPDARRRESNGRRCSRHAGQF